MVSQESSSKDRGSRESAILEAVLATVVDAIVTINSRGIIQHANPATCRMFGYTLDELLGQNVSILMPHPDRERHNDYISRYLQTGQAQIIGKGREVLAVRKDGSRLVVDLAVSEVHIDGERMFTGILRDMTARVQTEAALHREKNFAKNLLDTTNAIILLLNAEGQIVHVNPFMERISGYRLDEIVGRDWCDLFIPAEDRERARERFREVFLGTPLHGHVGTILRQNGQALWIAWSARRLSQADDLIDEGILAVGSDITQLKLAEQQLIQSERLAAIGQMVTGLAHESRNALQRSQACLEMLALDIDDQPELLELVNKIQKALTELQRLYEEVRGYAAPLKLELEPGSLLHLARDTWELLEENEQFPNVQLVCQDVDCVPRVEFDALRMRQVLRNIFENALAYSPSGSVVTVSCRPTLLHGDPAVELRIQDQGPGLSAEQAARIFDPFYTTSTRGTGLGMAIAQRIVMAHGGQIVTSPSLGEGTTIRVLLPVRPQRG